MILDLLAATFFIIGTVLSVLLGKSPNVIVAFFGCAVGFVAMLRIDAIERRVGK